MASSKTRVVLDLLGSPVVRRAEGSIIQLGGQSLRLLVRLHLGGGDTVSDSVLVDDLWGSRAVGSTALKAAVSRLRVSLGDASDVVRRTPVGYALDEGLIASDIARVDDLVAQARRSTGGATVVAFDEALAVWRGEAFAGMADELWLLSERVRLARLRSVVREERADVLLADGRAALAVPELVVALAADPYRERAIERLVRALYLAGDPVEALATLRSSVRRLRSDLGVEPSHRLRTLEHSLLTHAPDLGHPEAAVQTDDDNDAVDALLRSAEALRQADAIDDALRLVDRALMIARSSIPRRRAELLARRAVLLALAGRAGEGVAGLAEATRLARRDRNGESMAHVALTRFGFDAGAEDDDDLLVQLLEPIDLLPSRSTQRVDLLCAAMQQIVYSADSPAAEKLLAAAERAAVDIGDPRSKAVAESTRTFLTGFRYQDLDDQLRSAEAVFDEARSIADPMLLVAACIGVARARFDAGRIDECCAMLDVFREAADATAMPFAVIRPDLIDAAVRLAKGHTDWLEQRVLSIRERGERMHARSVRGSANSLLLGTWLELDRLEVLQASLAGRDGSAALIWQALAAMISAMQGDVGAFCRLDAVVAECASAAGLGWRAPFVAAFAIEGAYLCGHAEAAAAVEDRLADLGGRFLVLGPATITLGPVDRYLGLASMARGDATAAVARLRAAVDQCDRGGATIWGLRSRVELAAALRAHDDAGDSREAVGLLAAVAQAPTLAESPRLQRELRRHEATSR